MSEFKLTGDYYVSEWNGNSANPGTDVSPYAHPADLPVDSTNIVVIGTGYYVGGYTKIAQYRGDGDVIIDCQGATLTTTNGGSGTYLIEKITYKNINVFQTGNGNGGFFVDCNFDFNAINSQRLRFKRCLFLKDFSNSQTAYNPLYGSMYNCLLLASMTGGGQSNFEYSYLPKGKIIIVNTSAVAGNFQRSMINGLLSIAGTLYEVKKLADGTSRPDADPLIADLISYWPTCYSEQIYSGDAKLIDAVSRIVEPDSDLLKKTNANGFVGGVRPGKNIPVNASDPDITITYTDIDTSDPVNWIIQSPATEGYINIVWKISDTIAEVQRILLDALLSFYGDATGGTTENNNVPDNFPTSYSTLSAAGLKPNRLIYELRTSQSIGMPTVDSQWDNDSVALGTTAGNYYLQEWNTKPTIATVLGVPYGNGNPAGIGGATNGINARWGQARIRLTNNRAY